MVLAEAVDVETHFIGTDDLLDDLTEARPMGG
jgi:hypothetical protein